MEALSACFRGRCPAAGAFVQPPRAAPQVVAAALPPLAAPHLRLRIRAQAVGFGREQQQQGPPERRSRGAGSQSPQRRGSGGGRSGKQQRGPVRQPGGKPASELQRLNKVGAGDGRGWGGSWQAGWLGRAESCQLDPAVRCIKAGAASHAGQSPVRVDEQQSMHCWFPTAEMCMLQGISNRRRQLST